MTRNIAWLIGLILLLSAGSAAAATGTSFFGRWARGDGRARIRIEPCGAAACAINTWIRPGTPHEKTGDRLNLNVKPVRPKEWTGEAFDPQRNLTYTVKITVADRHMMTKGCMLAGLFVKRISWTRIGPSN